MLIDKSALEELTGGDEEITGIILEAYVDESESQINNLNTAFASEDWKNYTVYVHGMKSSSKSAGAMKAGESALELEMAGKEGNIALIKEKHQAFLELFKNSVAEAKEMM